MQYKTAVEWAFLQTEKEAAVLWGKILDAYSDSANAIMKEVAELYANIGNVAGDQLYNEAIKYGRLDGLMQSIEKEYKRYSGAADKLTYQSSNLMINNGAYRNQFILGNFSGKSIFSALNPWLVEQTVFGTEESWKRIQTKAFKNKWGNPTSYNRQTGTLKNTLLKNRTETIAKLKETITADIIQGKSYRETSRMIKNIIGAGEAKAGEISGSGASWKALRIAQTEGTRNYNAGNFASDMIFKDNFPKAKRVWSATLDKDTRPSHARLDGVPEDKDGLWHTDGASTDYPGHFGVPELDINCRCTVIIDIGIPDDTRRARNPITGKTEIFKAGNYEDWAKHYGLKQNQYGAWVMPTKK